MIYLSNINLNQNELQNARIQNLAVDPASPVAGQIWFNTALSQFKYYDGSSVLVIPEDTIAGSGAPTSSTKGNVGQLYLDTQNTKLYICTVSSTTYTWKGILMTDDLPPFEDTATNIKMDGTQSAGSLSTIPRADHVHPTDTSRLSTKPDGTHNIIDSNNKIDMIYIPESIIGQMEYKGTFDASTGATITGLEKGWYYICSVAGNKNPDGSAAASTYNIGDWAVYNGTSWDKVDNTDLVTMVNSQIGAVETYKGAWAASTNYYKGDIVLQNNSLWLCVATHTSAATWADTNWQIFGRVYTGSKGITLSGTDFQHTNNITAQGTQAVYPITIDAQGHIASYGSAEIILKKVSATLTGNGTNTDFEVSHSLGSDVIVEVYDASSNETVMVDVDRDTGKTIIKFAVAPAVGANYKVNIIG